MVKADKLDTILADKREKSKPEEKCYTERWSVIDEFVLS